MGMTTVTKTVRGLDADTYRAFRAKAVELDYSTGDAITEAMRLWVNAKGRPRVTVRALAQDAAAPPPPAIVDATAPATTG